MVDDDPDQRTLLHAILTAAGFEVSALEDGRELVDVLRMTPPRHFRLVVTDERMRGVHGTDALARTSSRAPRFVVVSAHETPDLRARVDRLGASFVRKPFDVSAFLALVDDVLLDDTSPDRPRG